MTSTYHSILTALTRIRWIGGVYCCLLLAGCRHPATTWQQLAVQRGCTPELIASTPAYDSSQVLQLVGTYRLVQIDTARGWHEFQRRYGKLGGEVKLTLWAADSAHRYSRVNSLTGKRVSINRPIVGALAGYEKAGFTADDPQVEVTGRRLDWLGLFFDPRPTLDGTVWGAPIERRGRWGFGGYFREGSYVVPMGIDGQPLPQRAGFYCAIRIP